MGLGVPEDYPRAPAEARGLISRRPAPALGFVTEVKIKVKVEVKVNIEGKGEGGQNGFVLRPDGHRIFALA